MQCFQITSRWTPFKSRHVDAHSMRLKATQTSIADHPNLLGKIETTIRDQIDAGSLFDTLQKAASEEQVKSLQTLQGLKLPFEGMGEQLKGLSPLNLDGILLQLEQLLTQAQGAASNMATSAASLAGDIHVPILPEFHPIEGVSEFAGRLEGLELQTVFQHLAGLLAAGWGLVTSPFAVFGPDMALVNILFIASILLLAYNVVAQAPRQ